MRSRTGRRRLPRCFPCASCPGRSAVFIRIWARWCSSMWWKARQIWIFIPTFGKTCCCRWACAAPLPRCRRRCCPRPPAITTSAGCCRTDASFSIRIAPPARYTIPRRGASAAMGGTFRAMQACSPQRRIWRGWHRGCCGGRFCQRRAFWKWAKTAQDTAWRTGRIRTIWAISATPSIPSRPTARCPPAFPTARWR